MANASSGLTAVATTNNTAVTAVAAGGPWHYVRIRNESAVAGFFSVDGGTVWHRLPVSATEILPVGHAIGPIQVKRVADGANVTDLFVSAF